MFFEDRAFVLTRYYYASEGVLSSCLTESNGKITLSSRRLLRSEKLGGKLDPLTIIDLEYYDDGERSVCLFLSSETVISSQMQDFFSIESFYCLSAIGEMCHFFLPERMVEPKVFSIIEYFLRLKNCRFDEAVFLLLMVMKNVVSESFECYCCICHALCLKSFYLNTEKPLFYCRRHVPAKHSHLDIFSNDLRYNLLQQMFENEKMSVLFELDYLQFYQHVLFILAMTQAKTGRYSSVYFVLLEVYKTVFNKKT